MVTEGRTKAPWRCHSLFGATDPPGKHEAITAVSLIWLDGRISEEIHKTWNPGLLPSKHIAFTTTLPTLTPRISEGIQLASCFGDLDEALIKHCLVLLGSKQKNAVAAAAAGYPFGTGKRFCHHCCFDLLIHSFIPSIYQGLCADTVLDAEEERWPCLCSWFWGGDWSQAGRGCVHMFHCPVICTKELPAEASDQGRLQGGGDHRQQVLK